MTQLEAALELLQGLEPAGVCARDLAERLCLQLRREDCRDPYVYRILEEHLEDMAAGRVSRIARSLGCGTEDVERSFARIRKLDPDPCAVFTPAAEPVYVRPDIYAHFGEQGWELQPLRLEDVAAATGFSVSTVSRVVQGKTVALERGSRPLRSFFSKSHHGHSVDELHRRIRELAALSPPLDDAAIAERLGLPRRTVAKYRLELGIPPARSRKHLMPVAKEGGF